MKNCRFDTNKVLLVELQSYEDQGISLWLEGEPSSSEAVTGKRSQSVYAGLCDR